MNSFPCLLIDIIPKGVMIKLKDTTPRPAGDRSDLPELRDFYVLLQSKTERKT